MTGQYQIPASYIACLVQYGCLVNEVAAEQLSLLNGTILNIICLSHACNVAGMQLNASGGQIYFTMV
jgi:hypothetical protein